MPFLCNVRKNLVLCLALVLALSTFGGASATAWVHADGSLCYTCPEAAPEPVKDACCPSTETETVLSALDCQVCCQAEGEAQSQHKVRPAHVAVLSGQPAMAQVFRIQAGIFATQRTLARKTTPHRLPSLRAPPARGRLRFL